MIPPQVCVSQDHNYIGYHSYTLCEHVNIAQWWIQGEEHKQVEIHTIKKENPL